MGPTKAIVKGQALYEALGGKLIKDGFTNRQDMEDYVSRHYLTLPVVDQQGRPWLLDGKPVYCLHGTQYETMNDALVHLVRCLDCGGMGFDSTNSLSNRTASTAQLAGLNSMPGWK
jgi:hypothetical protein